MTHTVWFSNARSTMVFWNFLENTGWRRYVHLARTWEESQRGQHTAFYHTLFSSEVKGCYKGHWLEVTLWKTTPPGPATDISVFCDSGKRGFSHFPWGPVPAMRQPPKFTFWKTHKRTSSAASSEGIKWQNFVFKGHWHLTLKRNLNF